MQPAQSSNATLPCVVRTEAMTIPESPTGSSDGADLSPWPSPSPSVRSLTPSKSSPSKSLFGRALLNNVAAATATPHSATTASSSDAYKSPEILMRFQSSLLPAAKQLLAKIAALRPPQKAPQEDEMLVADAGIECLDIIDSLLAKASLLNAPTELRDLSLTLVCIETTLRTYTNDVLLKGVDGRPLVAFDVTLTLYVEWRHPLLCFVCDVHSSRLSALFLSQTPQYHFAHAGADVLSVKQFLFLFNLWLFWIC
jgi:hypothetical protein